MATVTHPESLDALDVLHCGPSPAERGFVKIWHRLSRCFTAGRENKDNPNIAIHTAMVFPIWSRLFAVEMIGPDQGLRISALNRTWDGLERNIISISRGKGLDINRGLDRIVSDLDRWLGYDVKQALKYAFPFLTDDPSKPICSSYVKAVLRDIGQYFPPGMGSAPVDLQNCSTLMEVRGW